ncbi:MAG: glycosyltransferase 87 family protein [Actinomycetota bacterium]
MAPRRSGFIDALLYGAAAVFAAGTMLLAAIPLFREWGRIALGPYAIGCAAALLVARRRSNLGARVSVATFVFVAAALLPMAIEVVWRAGSAPGLHAQSEVIVTEEAARALIDGRNPYATAYVDGPLAARPLATKTHFPYLPGMLAFGMPRAIDSRSPFADARLWFAATAIGAGGLALTRIRANGDARLRLAQVLVVLPTGALLMATGGDDLPVLAAMLLALALAEASPGWAGLAAGVAGALKQTAWPLLPFLILSSPRRGRTAVAAAATLIAIVGPFAAWDLGAFLEDAVRFPLGLGKGESAAGTPTLGALIAAVAGDAVAVVVLLGAIGVVAVWAGRRMDAGPAGAARGAALVWAVAFVLAPVARFGYVVYPVNLFLWSAVAWKDERAGPLARDALEHRRPPASP